jgi:hypothetical protein
MKYKLEAEKNRLATFLLSGEEFDQHLFDSYSPKVVLHADAALKLKTEGCQVVIGVKNGGLRYSKVFEMMGYEQSEIDYSHHKRKMQEPLIEDEELEKLRGKKVILTDNDFVTGITLQRIVEYLREREVNVGAAYMGLDCWPGIEDICNSGFWITGKNGLRELNEDLEKRFFNGLKIYTSTEKVRTREAKKRVLNYLLKV